MTTLVCKEFDWGWGDEENEGKDNHVDSIETRRYRRGACRGTFPKVPSVTQDIIECVKEMRERVRERERHTHKTHIQTHAHKRAYVLSVFLVQECRTPVCFHATGSRRRARVKLRRV